jgi:hypothetical protein
MIFAYDRDAHLPDLALQIVPPAPRRAIVRRAAPVPVTPHALIVGYIAGLCLPRRITRVVGGINLTQTDQRGRAAVAVYEALPRLDLATVSTIARAVKRGPWETLVAIKDCVAAGVVEQQGITYRVRGGK